MATTRKAWRFGKQFEYWSQMKQVIKVEQDELKKALKISKLMSFSLWALYESIGLLNANKIINVKDAKLLQDRANICWVYGLVSSLLVNFYTFRWNSIRLNQELKINAPLPGKGLDDVPWAKAPLQPLRKERKALLEAMFLDLLDITIPLSGLGYLNISELTVGACGTLSSAISVCYYC